MNNPHTRLILVSSILTTLCLTGCTQQYDADSRQKSLPQECQIFNDGCNLCNKQADGTALCTQEQCESYKKPTCLDETLTDTQKQKLTNGIPTSDSSSPDTPTPTETQPAPVDVSRPAWLHPTRDTDNDGLNDCETTGACDDTVDYNKPNPTVIASLKERYVGKPVSEAQEIANKQNDNVIVAMIDGTAQYEPTQAVLWRVNFIVINGNVADLIVE